MSSINEINSKLTQEEYQEYLNLIEQKFSQRQACNILGISRGLIQHYLKRVAELENKEIEEQQENKHTLAESFIKVGKSFQKLSDSLSSYKNTDHGKSFDEFELFDKPKKPTICVIADTQCKPTESLEYILWMGRYIAEKKPDILVMIGDFYDFPSLSSYDKGKASSEGRRFVDDLNAGNKGLELLNLELSKDPTYQPRKVFCKGNHEYRVDRYVEDNPELKGTLGTEFLPLAQYGWEVYDFLNPVKIEDIYFVHYLANPMNGRPYGGNAMNILKTVGCSYVVGHKQTLDVAIRPTIDGKLQIGIVNGAAYPFDEGYKGYQGNNHFRGITMLHECHEGFGTPMFVSLDYMKEKYYS